MWLLWLHCLCGTTDELDSMIYSSLCTVIIIIASDFDIHLDTENTPDVYLKIAMAASKAVPYRLKQVGRIHNKINISSVLRVRILDLIVNLCIVCTACLCTS